MLQFEWLENNDVTFQKDIELTSFKLVNVEKIIYENIFYSDTYPAMKITLYLKRYISFYILQVRL